MNARFGIIALGIALGGCNDGSSDDLFVKETSAALDCTGAGCTFSGATKPGDAPEPRDPGGYGGHGGDDDHDSDDDDHYGEGGAGHADAGAPCAYDDDCDTGEKCERRHGVSYCAPDDDDDSDDDGHHGGDDPEHAAPEEDPPCNGYDCDYDRSGSNSGPH